MGDQQGRPGAVSLGPFIGVAYGGDQGLVARSLKLSNVYLG